MSKKIYKYMMIILSSLYIVIDLIIIGPINKIMDVALDYEENIPFVIAVILLLIGIFIDATDKKINENAKLRKYKILKIIGYIPFIIVILYGIFRSFTGFDFFLKTTYGLPAFFGSIFILSILFMWPFYIIGIALIVKSKKLIKQIIEKKW